MSVMGKLELHGCIVIFVVCYLEGNFGQLVISAEDLDLFHGESGSINCSVQAGSQVTWSDVSVDPTVQIFFGTVGSDSIQKGLNAGPGTKYENFDIDSPEGSTQFNLKISDAQFNEDEGTYDCQVFGGGSSAGQLSIAVLPPVVDISCTLTDCLGMDEISQNDVKCTCSATGVFPQHLEIIWDGAMGSPTTERISSATGLSGTFDLRSEAVAQQVNGTEMASCSLSGYAKDPGSRGESIALVSPTCSLQEPLNEVCKDAVFTCKVENEPYPADLSFLFFFGNGTQLQSGQEDNIQLDIEKGSTVELYCIACNSFGSHQSDTVSYECLTGPFQLPPTTPHIITGDGTRTSISITPGDKTDNGCEASLSLGLIVTCCIEGVVVIAMIFVIGFLYSIKKGWRKKDPPNLAIQLHDTSDNANSAYMDLQDTKTSSPNNAYAEVPYENLELREPLPGKGLVIYQRAQMITTSEREEIVVKTVSDDSPVRLEKLQVDEIRMLSALSSNVNVVQFFGCCHRVPSLLCFEFVSGNNLAKYLEENFQRSKIHQYGNTKQKRFHVAEKGSVEILPRFALQIARGMKYLNTHKFLHPGLRSEKVIIDVSGQCKLYDFVSKDNAKEIIAILWGKSVPYQWMPPEYLFLEKLNPTVDVWSFGVVLWEIFSYGAKPYEGNSRSDVEKRFREKEFLEIPNNCPGAIWQIVLNCWEQSPEKRPSFDHLYVQLSHMCNENKEYDEIHSK